MLQPEKRQHHITAADPDGVADDRVPGGCAGSDRVEEEEEGSRTERGEDEKLGLPEDGGWAL